MTDAGRPGSGSPAADAMRVERRRFFRAIADDALHAAATLVGTAGALRAAAQETATGLAEEVTEASRPPAGRLVPGASPGGVPDAFRLDGDRLILVDQRRLPDDVVEVACDSAADVAGAIRDMVTCGAPALGQVAALGLAIAARRAVDARPYARRAILRGSAVALVNAAPTTVSVRWATNRMLARHAAVGELLEDGASVAAALRAEADAIVDEAAADHRALARQAADLLPRVEDRPLRLLTHGPTGRLGGGRVGTALAVVEVLVAEGRDVRVHVAETRPGLEGARLTAWELERAGVPHVLLADSAAGWLMARGEVDAILVGADCVAANGDAASTLGTYPLAVLAARHGVPFLVLAPSATLDATCPDGSAIPVELRRVEAVTSIAGRRNAPAASPAIDPAFDVTPAELVTAIVTEAGVLWPPVGPAIAATIAAREERHPAPPPSPGITGPGAAAPLAASAGSDD